MSASHENRATSSNDAQKTPARQNQSGFAGRSSYVNDTSNARGYQTEYRSRTLPFSSPSIHSDGPQSAFSIRQTSHLPTPQSPSNLGSYLGGAPRTPESPIPSGSQSMYPAIATPHFHQRPIFPFQQDVRPAPPPLRLLSPSRSQQTLTPESSPVVDRNLERHVGMASLQSPSPVATSKANVPRVKAESLMTSLTPAQMVTPSAQMPEPPRSALSSPFMAKASVGDRSSKQHSTPTSSSQRPVNPAHIHDIFSIESIVSASARRELPRTSSGGEIDRIRQQMLDDDLAHMRQAEDRRPEYLQRTKRSFVETYHFLDPALDFEDREGPFPGVGITESPMKGRRLKLFQETSEESFEESLMTGGYERYRNANPDWMPQAPPGPSLSTDTEPVLSEKEARKRRRLAAFGDLSSGVPPPSKLFPVDVVGKGRLILDSRQNEPPVSTDTSPTKKKTPRRKKKAASETLTDVNPVVERISDAAVPDWPDSEFPWSLRLEEQTEKVRAAQEERLRWIEKFLDRDSDEEDEGEDDEILPSTMWGQVYEDAPMPSRRGRGKMVGLPASPRDGSKAGVFRNSDGPLRRRAFFPSDPADARAALLSKRSVRMLSYRTQQRTMRGRPKTWEEDSDDDETCVCGGKNAGELVQCDACNTWYHLRCIGINSVKELGNEEDPWFCGKCVVDEVVRTPSPELIPSSSEPTFVPTDERQTPAPSDSLFYQSLPLPASPSPPWHSSGPPSTPIRGAARTPYSSGSSSADPARHGPSTPRLSSHEVRVYTTPGPFDNFGSDDSSFDPTSTPSRGITFGAPFATPKNAVWLARASGMFQTPLSLRAFESPSRPQIGGSVMESGDTLPSFSTYRHQTAHDESPIRRILSGDPPRFAMSSRFPESPAPRFLNGYHNLQESPVMPSKAHNRTQDPFDAPSLDARGSMRHPPGPASGSAH